MRKLTGGKLKDGHMRSNAEEKRQRRGAWHVALAALFLVSSPAFAGGPPYRTDDPEPADYQHFELYIHSTGEHVFGGTTGVGPAVELDYGILPDLQLSIIAPMAFDRATGAPFNWGYGDTDIGLKYRFIEQDKNGWGFSAAVEPAISVPTGDARRSLGRTGATSTFLPVWLEKVVGDWIVTGGGGYGINPGFRNKNFWLLSGLLERKITDRLTIGAEIFHETPARAGEKDTTGFNVGGTYDIADHYRFLLSVGRGIQNAKQTNQLSWYIGLEVATGGVDKPSQSEERAPKAAPDTPSAAFTWTGFYAGAEFGHVWQRANEADVIGGEGPFSLSYSPKGPIGGPFTGFNWQTGPAVLGIEGDVEIAGVTGGEGRFLAGMEQRHDVRGSARGRAGVALDRFLLYGTGGVALANFFNHAQGESFSQARPGWTLGGGVEYAIADNWSGRIEYRYSDFGSTTYVSSTAGNFYRINVSDNSVRGGIAYHFNFAEPGPAVPQY